MSRYLPVRTRAALAQQTVCQECGGPGPFHNDHIVAVGLFGGNEPENLQKLCEVCHHLKTRDDRQMIAKANRIRKKREQKDRRIKRKIQSRGFRKDLRRHMDGRVERRI